MKKYKSDIPNLHIMADMNFDNGAKDRIELGQFDENGELETDNVMLISRLAQLGYQPLEEVVKKATEEVIEPIVEIVETEQAEETQEIEEVEEAETYTCKKCDFTTDNKGELLAHYKKEHPKK